MRILRNFLYFLLGFMLMMVFVASPAFAADYVDASHPWAVASRDAGGNLVYTRALPPSSVAQGAVNASITGLNGYNNITQSADGVVLRRVMPLFNDAGIIKGTEVGLSKPIASAAMTDSLLLPASAVASGARALLKGAGYAGVVITAYDIYKALQNDGITQDPISRDLIKTATYAPHEILKDPPSYGVLVGSSDCRLSTPAAAMACRVTEANKTSSPVVCPPGGGFSYNSSLGQYQYNRSQCTPSGQTGYFQIGPNCASGSTLKSGSNPPQCSYGNGCETGDTLVGSSCQSKIPATNTEIEGAIVNEPLSNLPNYVNELAQHGDGTFPVPFDTDATTTFNQPSYSTSPSVTTSTTTNPDGSTSSLRTEKSQTVTPSVTGGKANSQSVIFNVTNVTNVFNNGTLVNHTDEQQTQPPPTTTNPADPSDPCKDSGCAFIDPTMPGQPHLYDQKYPDGIVGVWNNKKAELMNTGFVLGISRMFPSLADGGTCPSTTLDLNMGINDYTNFGTHALAVDCSLWSIIGAVMLISACFVARQILWG